jgi:hypothetical protein
LDDSRDDSYRVADLDSASVALVKGDVVCLRADASGNTVVTKTLPGPLAFAGTGWGIAKNAVSPGTRDFFFDLNDGMIPPTYTGLAAGAPGRVRISSTGPERRDPVRF